MHDRHWMKLHSQRQTTERICLALTFITMMMMMMIAQAIFSSFDRSRIRTFTPCVVAFTGQCKKLLSCASGSREGRKPREMRAMRPDSMLDSIKTKLALHEDLQARCFKHVRAPKLTAENHMER